MRKCESAILLSSTQPLKQHVGLARQVMGRRAFGNEKYQRSLNGYFFIAA
jgi:hypothetical protein